MDQRGELHQADAPRGPLEGVVTAVQLVERRGLVVPRAELQHQALDPLEEVGGVGDEGLANLRVEFEEAGGTVAGWTFAVEFDARSGRNRTGWRKLVARRG